MYLYEVPDGPAAASLSQSQRRGQRGDAKGSGPAVAPRCSFACPAALLRPAWTPSPGRKPSSIEAPGWHRPGLDRLTGCRTGWIFFFFYPSPALSPSLPSSPALPCPACLSACPSPVVVQTAPPEDSVHPGVPGRSSRSTRPARSLQPFHRLHQGHQVHQVHQVHELLPLTRRGG